MTAVHGISVAGAETSGTVGKTLIVGHCGGVTSFRRALVLAVALAAAACSTVGNDVVATDADAKKKIEVAADPDARGRSDRSVQTTSATGPGPAAAPAAAPAGAESAGDERAGTAADGPVDDFLDNQPADNLDELPDPATDPDADPVAPPDYGRDLGGTALPRPGSAGAVAPAAGSGPLVNGGTGPARPALVVKVDNAWGAWPQSGVNEADVVFEILVEGISRFAAVYHSESPALVGPVRSARTSDLNLVAMLNRPLFAWSGGNPGVQIALSSTTSLTDVGFYAKPGAYFRSSNREMPHNLYSSAASLWSAGGGAGSPDQIFDYRSTAGSVAATTTSTTSVPASSIAATPDTAAAPETAAAPASLGREVGGVEYALAATQVAFVWQQSTQRWLRFQSNYPHLDDNDIQVSPTNVIVLETPYQPSVVDARSPEALTVGSGRALALVEGRAIEGTWSRGGERQPYSLVGDDGRRIELLPGRTWVALVMPGGSARLLDTSFVKP